MVSVGFVIGQTNSTADTNFTNPGHLPYCSTIGEIVSLVECDFGIVTEDGRQFEILDYDKDFQLYEGRKVKFDYDSLGEIATFCMFGEPIKITCISDYSPVDSCWVIYRYKAVDILAHINTMYYAGLAYQFFPYASDSIIEIEWTVDGDVRSQEMEPILTFPTAGIYQVGVKVFTENGCETKYVSTINLNQTCTAIIDVTEPKCGPFEKCGRNYYTFTDVSGYDVSYRAWYIAGDTIENEKWLDWKFYKPGTYDVCLDIETVQGCRASTCIQVTITDKDSCGANIQYTKLRCADNERCGENSYVIWDESGIDAAFKTWIINGTDTVENTNKVYYQFASSYNNSVCLEINSPACYSYDCITIADSQPNCEAKIQVDYISCDTTYPDCAITAYLQDVSGLPNAKRTWIVENEDTVYNQPYLYLDYPKNGTKEVCLIVETSNCWAITCVDIGNDTANCYTEFTYYNGTDSLVILPALIAPEMAYQFISYSNPEAVRWSWDFGDGGTSTEQNPFHIYSQPGVYGVHLKTTTANGCTAEYHDSIFVQSAENCKANFEYCNYSLPAVFDSVDVIQPYIIGFNNLSKGRNLKYKWSFGDGTTSNDKNPVHVYSKRGVYNVCLKVYNGLCTDTQCMKVYVGMPNCDIDFYVEVLVPDCYGFKPAYRFVIPQDVNLNAIKWEFGDGESSTDFQPIHMYSQYGIYNACVTVKYPDGCIAKECVAIYVTQENIDSIFEKSCGTTPVMRLDEAQEFSISNVYPVPAKSNMTIDFISEADKNIELRVVNLLGRTVYSKSAINVNQGNNQLNIDVSGFDEGTYVYQLYSGNTVHRGNFNVKK